jgi:molybdenum cofactor cytidylyltransferase
MMALSGDTGARKLIADHADLVAEIEMENDSVLIDIDTPEALAELRGKVRPSAA